MGSLNVDLVAAVRELPEPGETVLAVGLRRLPGGKGANQAAAASAAGASVRLSGCVGADADGDAYLRGLADRGVDVSSVRRVPDVPTGTAFITVDREGENTIVVVPGANAQVGAADLATDGEDVVLLQLEVPVDVVAEAVRRASDAGIRVVLNVAPYADLPLDVLDRCDPVVANQVESGGFDRPPRSLVVTLGSRGARWFRDGRSIEVEAPAVPVVDTTGAGDAFAGALAAALAAGRADEEALTLAVQAGADAVTRPGAQGWELAL